MFYLLEFSRQFATEGNDLADKYLQFVRLFYVMCSMVCGLVLVYSIYEISVLTSASSGILEGLTTTIWGWGIIMTLTLFFMVVYFLLIIPKKMKKALELKGRVDDGGGD